MRGIIFIIIQIGKRYNLKHVITERRPEVSCKTIKEKYDYALSGMYWINLFPATQVYCDMDTDGGLYITYNI